MNVRHSKTDAMINSDQNTKRFSEDVNRFLGVVGTLLESLLDARQKTLVDDFRLNAHLEKHARRLSQTKLVEHRNSHVSRAGSLELQKEVSTVGSEVSTADALRCTGIADYRWPLELTSGSLHDQDLDKDKDSWRNQLSLRPNSAKVAWSGGVHQPKTAGADLNQPSMVSDVIACQTPPNPPDARCSSHALSEYLHHQSTFRLEMRAGWRNVIDNRGVALSECEKAVTMEVVRKGSDRLSAKPVRSLSRALQTEKGRLPTIAEMCRKLKESRFVMHPTSPVRLVWNIVTFLLVASDIITVPLSAFDGPTDSTMFNAFEWCCTLFWTVDLFMSFRTGYFVGLQVEMRPAMIAREYIKTWLFIDVSIVCFEWANRFFAEFASATLLRTTRIVRVIRCVKLLRVAKLKEMVRDSFEQINSIVFHLMWKICALALVLSLFLHVVSCFWFALGRSSPDGWQSYDDYANEKEVNFWFWYMASARWVLSQLNGRTDLDERRNMRERAFTVVGGLLMSVIMQAMFISLITKTMIDLSSIFKEQITRRRRVNEFLSMHSLPVRIVRATKMHVRLYQDVVKQREKERYVLGLLPMHMKVELLFAARKPYLTMHPIFHTITDKYLSAARHLSANVFLPVFTSSFEIIFEEGDPCQVMRFMATGKTTYGRNMHDDYDGPEVQADQEVEMEVLPRDSDCPLKPQKLSFGDWISEIALWAMWHNLGRLRADENCSLIEVDATKLVETFEFHPHACATAALYAKAFLDSVSAYEISDILGFQVVTDGSVEDNACD